MTIKSKLRGHDIEFINNEWVYSDTKEPTRNSWEERPCGYCNKPSTVEGHDACLGTLPGVINACCGHGEVDEAYVQYKNGTVIRGKTAIEVMEFIKMHRIR